MENPLVSIIVPIYKIDRYIGICIESLINQTYKNIEIILVDDGSPDRCPEICELYAKKDERIKVIHKKNGGLVSARKAGLEIAKGEYIGYVDGDDWVGAGFYESMVSSVVMSACDMVCAGYTRDLFFQSDSFLNSCSVGLYKGKDLQELRMQMLSYGDFYRPGITTYVWNKLFKRDVLFAWQMKVDERISIGEDAAVTYPVLMECKSVYVSDCVAYHYRQREDSMLKQSTSFEKEAVKLRILYEYLMEISKKHEKKLDKQIIDYVLGICIMRSGGRLSDDSYSTFNDIYYGKKIVVYSAGTFGQQLLKRFEERKHCEVVAWVDDDYWEYRRCCLDVDPVEIITKTDFDYILIATVDCKVAEEATKRLCDYGIGKSKILSVVCGEPEERGELLRRFLY